jgi:hypothetical protein
MSTTAMVIGVSINALGIAIVVVNTGTLAPMLVGHANIITTIKLFGCVPSRTKADICTTMVSFC